MFLSVRDSNGEIFDSKMVLLILFIDNFRIVACTLLVTEVTLMLPFSGLLCGLLPCTASCFTVVKLS